MFAGCLLHGVSPGPGQNNGVERVDNAVGRGRTRDCTLNLCKLVSTRQCSVYTIEAKSFLCRTWCGESLAFYSLFRFLHVYIHATRIAMTFRLIGFFFTLSVRLATTVLCNDMYARKRDFSIFFYFVCEFSLLLTSHVRPNVDH